MTFLVNLFRALPLLWVGLMLSGCLPSSQGQLDEEKESHFLAGKSRVNAMDYTGAVECFEKALEVNPQNAAAHFELGVLYEKLDTDPSIAIYHYNQYLKLQPKAGNADIINQHILACKQELARTISLGPVSEKMQRDLEKVVEENKRLTEENKRLNEEVNKWRVYYVSRMQQQQQQQTLAPVQPVSTPASESSGSSASPAGRPAGNAGAAPGGGARSSASTNSAVASATAHSAAPPATPRTHVIRRGETLTLISREYGVKQELILRYNPHLDPRRMREGQTINLPPP